MADEISGPAAGRRWRSSLGTALSMGLIVASANYSASASSSSDSLVCGKDAGDLADHIFGNHRFGPQSPGHSEGGHHRHFGHHRAPHSHPANDFVRRAGAELKLGGKEFRFAGTNNYYSAYKSELMVDDVLGDADDQGFTVLRTWAFIDIGNQDGTNATRGKADAVVYYHYKNPGAEPAFNDGPDGLQHLDYVVFKAGQLGLKLVLPLTNNWGDFGGMDQYVAWAGGQFHDQFYTDPQIRAWYKQWVSHVLNHKNFYTGVRYKDDPTIMTWELTNEARCGGSGLFPKSDSCSSTTITAWANEMSSYVKHVDHKHLVSVGDEGFYCIPGSPNFIDSCSDGVDTLALTALPNIDVMSFHLYPNSWGQTVAWGQDFIERHFADALALHKPAMLGEFGLLDKAKRNPNYKLWTDTVFDVGGAGALYWMLAGTQDDGTLYPDYDGFTVYCPSPVCSAYSHFSAEMTANRALTFPPVADDDNAETTAGFPATLNALANDVTYGAATLLPTSIDLDPAAPGQQVTLTTAQGTFAAGMDGVITFTPLVDFVGAAEAVYTVSDNLGQSSEEAVLSVTVKPAPPPTNALYSFESGTQGWDPASFNPGAGTVEQSSEFQSDGRFSLKITPSGGGWFGVESTEPIDLSGTVHVTWQVKTTDSGTSQELALQTGDGTAFCQAGGFQFINANTTADIDIDLSTIDCGGGVLDLSQVHKFYIFAGNGGPGAVYLDQIRAVKASDLPPPGQLFGFETSTQNWAAASFNAAGAVEQSTDFASNGQSSLKVTPTAGGWFGVEYKTNLLNLSGKTHVSWDVKTTDFGTSQELALQTGTDFAFCQAGGSQFVNAGTTTHIDIDLGTLVCPVGLSPNLALIDAFYIFMGNSGDAPIYIDNVVAE